MRWKVGRVDSYAVALLIIWNRIEFLTAWYSLRYQFRSGKRRSRLTSFPSERKRGLTFPPAFRPPLSTSSLRVRRRAITDYNCCHSLPYGTTPPCYIYWPSSPHLPPFPSLLLHFLPLPTLLSYLPFSPHLLFLLSLLGCEDDLDVVMSEIADKIGEAPSLQTAEEGTPCLAKFSQDGAW